jgi:hypothetical protein
MAGITLLPTVTVGTTAVQVDARGLMVRGFSSISMQADVLNSGTIYVGDSTVTTSLYARALKASDWLTLSVDGADGSEIWVVGSAAGQILHPSGV